MRDALNNNPLVQAAAVGVLLVLVALFVVSSGGGSGEEEAGTTEATVSVTGTDATGTATGATAGEAVEGAVEAAAEAAGQDTSLALPGQVTTSAPPLPQPVLEAWKANRTLVLLFVHDGGIDDRLVKAATDGISGFPRASIFIVPARQISRYAAITEGVGVDRVPALVVVTPKPLKDVVPTASVNYGFQSEASIRQAVIDAGYKGPTIDYHP